jgi:hypothetical protein
MSQFSSDVFARVMRLVVPMRREFGRNIDVQKFLYDLAYAEEVLNLAINSQNEKVKDAAEYLWRLVFGPRELRSAPAEKKSVAGERSEGLLVAVEAAIGGSLDAITFDFSGGGEETGLRAELMGKCAAAVR